MLEKVKEIVAEGLDVNAADLTEETTFESLGADSLDLMDMVMTFEDEFGVEIDTEAIGDLKTIGSVVTYIEGLKKLRIAKTQTERGCNMKTEVTELLGIEYPIIQGGMAWVAEYHLAAGVSNAGGLGLIGAASAPAEWVREQIREAKKAD